ncbi:hypothetical protein BBJ28_00010753 [Nothophytophthora sp. Chile5]|nr:hypothetical protein BBJ28_00010753 [Nothophytophthora sp. Chile5]
MLTVKLANKEKETELLRCKQDAVDRDFAQHEHTLRQQQEEHGQVIAELTSMNQELQRQVQLLQIQCDRVRAADVEKKRNQLSRVEDQLTVELAALKKENNELKARRGQMSSQSKHLQARVAALESANTTQDQKLQDAEAELESARKYCRDCQFRTKQLQEEIMFLKNRKVVIDAPKPRAKAPQLASLELISQHEASSSPESPKECVEAQTGDEMPCWMK